MIMYGQLGAIQVQFVGRCRSNPGVRDGFHSRLVNSLVMAFPSVPDVLQRIGQI